jgi:hypothetical protein
MGWLLFPLVVLYVAAGVRASRVMARLVAIALGALVLAPLAIAAAVPPGRTDPATMLTAFERGRPDADPAWGATITCNNKPIAYGSRKPGDTTTHTTVPSGPYHTKSVPHGTQRTYGCIPDIPPGALLTPVEIVFGGKHQFLFALVGTPGYAPYCRITQVRGGYRVNCATAIAGATSSIVIVP